MLSERCDCDPVVACPCKRASLYIWTTAFDQSPAVFIFAQVRPLSTAEKAAKARHRVFIQRPGVVQMRALRFGGSTAGQDEYVFETDRVYMMGGKESSAQLFQEMVAPAVTSSFLQGVNTLVRVPAGDGPLLPSDVALPSGHLMCSRGVRVY